MIAYIDKPLFSRATVVFFFHLKAGYLETTQRYLWYLSPNNQ